MPQPMLHAVGFRPVSCPLRSDSFVERRLPKRRVTLDQVRAMELTALKMASRFQHVPLGCEAVPDGDGNVVGTGVQWIGASSCCVVVFVVPFWFTRVSVPVCLCVSVILSFCHSVILPLSVSVSESVSVCASASASVCAFLSLSLSFFLLSTWQARFGRIRPP